MHYFCGALAVDRRRPQSVPSWDNSRRDQSSPEMDGRLEFDVVPVRGPGRPDWTMQNYPRAAHLCSPSYPHMPGQSQTGWQRLGISRGWKREHYHKMCSYCASYRRRHLEGPQSSTGRSGCMAVNSVYSSGVWDGGFPYFLHQTVFQRASLPTIAFGPIPCEESINPSS